MGRGYLRAADGSSFCTLAEGIIGQMISCTDNGRFLPISARSPQKKCSLNTSVNGTACTRGSPGRLCPRGSAASPRLLEPDACACYYAGRRETRSMASLAMGFTEGARLTMIVYEMRTYTVQVGKMPEAIRL